MSMEATIERHTFEYTQLDHVEANGRWWWKMLMEARICTTLVMHCIPHIKWEWWCQRPWDPVFAWSADWVSFFTHSLPLAFWKGHALSKWHIMTSIHHVNQRTNPAYTYTFEFEYKRMHVNFSPFCCGNSIFHIHAHTLLLFYCITVITIHECWN